jgi:copper chaperone CopZ
MGLTLVMVSEPLTDKGKAILRISHDIDEKKLDFGKIELSLKNLYGITSVSINEITGMVKVEYNPRKITLDEIRQSLEKLQKSEKR